MQDGHLGVVLGDGVLRGAGGVVRGGDLGQLAQAGVPAGGVVVLGVEALGTGFGEGLDEGFGGSGGLAVADPGDFAVAVVVEGVDGGLVVAEVGPAEVGQLLLGNEDLQIGRVVGGVGQGPRLAMTMAAGGEEGKRESRGDRRSG